MEKLFKKERVRLEKFNGANFRPTLNEMYALYDYKPTKEVLNEKVEQKFLTFEWNPDQIKQIHKALNKILDIGINSYKDVSEVISFGNDLEFEVKYLRSGTDQTLKTRFYLDENSIAEFEFTQISDSNSDTNWTLTHRFVSEEYRGQDIGSKMLQILEQGIQYIAEIGKKPQVLEIDARQLGIINFAFKNGYRLATKEDQDALKLIYAGDRSKILITTAPELKNNDDQKHGFIFSIEQLQKIAQDQGMGNLSPEQIWGLDLNKLFPGNSYEYLSHALTIVFKKEKQP